MYDIEEFLNVLFVKKCGFKLSGTVYLLNLFSTYIKLTSWLLICDVSLVFFVCRCTKYCLIKERGSVVYVEIVRDAAEGWRERGDGSRTGRCVSGRTCCVSLTGRAFEGSLINYCALATWSHALYLAILPNQRSRNKT